MILLALALAAAAHPHPSRASAPPSLSQRERGKTPKAAKGEGDAIDAVARRYALAGELLVAKGDRIVLHRAYGTIAPTGGARHKVGERWRLASVTKQVTATAIMRMVARGDLALDTPLPVSAGSPLSGLTPRMLLTHHSGLANPDATPKDAFGVPGFYTARTIDQGYCTSKPARPGAAFDYNNCDFLLLGDLLDAGEGEAGERDNALWPGEFATADTQRRSVPGFVGGKPEPAFNLATYATAGGLLGTARALYDFDRALMTGKLLPASAREELWEPEGNGSYQALGQWVFPGRLAGCTAPKRIVQRDGEIAGVQVRNFILPDNDIVAIVFTNRSSDDFAIGEVWQGKGFSHDLLSAAACA